MLPLHGAAHRRRRRWAAFSLLFGAASLLLFGAATCSNGDGDSTHADAAAAPRAAERVQTAPGEVALAETEAATERVAALRRAFPTAMTTQRARFEAASTGTRAVVPASPGAAAPRGRVRASLPIDARGAVTIEDETSDVAISVSLVDGPSGAVVAAPLEVGDGAAVYAGALGGADVFFAVRASSVEDLVRFPARPAAPEVRYSVDVSRVAGVHQAGRTLEFVDKGIPRLRMAPPFLLAADGKRHEASVDVTGCVVDRSPGVAHRHGPTAPGATRCEVRVAWRDEGVVYPAVLDPDWQNSTTQMTARNDHTSTILSSGDVLIAGGYDPVTGAALASAEIFCPPEKCGVNGIFGQTIADDLQEARGGHTATLIDPSHVLIVGGKSDAAAPGALATAEIYDEVAQSFSFTTTSPLAARVEHAAVLLDDGRVLLVGGVDLANAELYDPAGAGFGAATIPLHDERRAPIAALTGHNGQVLVAGGIGALASGGIKLAVSSAEIFDPMMGDTFTALPTGMTSVRAHAAAVRLEDVEGKVLITGGANEIGVTFKTAELYDPTVGFVAQLIQMQAKRRFHTATVLKDQGQVLLTGGDDNGVRTAKTEVYDLANPGQTSLDSTMNAPRTHHAATLLGSGQVVVSGGEDPAAAEHYAEVLQRKDGEICDSAGECAHGICSKEKVCCNLPCDGLCDTCFHGAGDPTNGQCLPIPALGGPQAGCKDDVEFTLVCDGDGGITAGDISPCKAYACIPAMGPSPPRCRTDADGCTSDADCSVKNGWCDLTHTEVDGGPNVPVCALKLPSGGPSCTGAVQCESGNCVDGYCCDSTCEGQCEACNNAENKGICSQVAGPVHVGNGRVDCDAAGTECEGACGSNRSTCDYGTGPCGNSMCVGDMVIGGSCGKGLDGIQTCTDVPQSCGDYQCKPDQSDCFETCQTTAECASGRVCTPGNDCVEVHETACDNDERTLVSPDGTTKDCAPFRCRDTACIQRCASVDDCIAPSVCDDQGNCVDAPTPAVVSGCAVSSGSGDRGAGPWVLGLLVAALVVARRGRRRAAAALAAVMGVQTVFAGSLASAQPAAAKQTGGQLGDAPDPEGKSEPDPAKREDAKKHFVRGLELLKQDAWQAALAEFVRSRELYPTRSATVNAGVVLRKLERFDEALDMFESSLRDFGGWPVAEKQSAQKAVAELRELVGTIEITGSVPGATIVVDGKNRADYPTVEPLRVGAGSHTVRVFKVGFVPFETRTDVAGGQTARIVAPLKALAASGRLRVAEASGKKLDVVIDGAVVGVTPWEGVLSTGGHAVLLRGDEDWGTAPAAAKIRTNETTALTLGAVHLESSIVIEVVPTGAEITIDAVPVGNGVWEGRLAAGGHRFEARAEGFFPRAESVSLSRGEAKKLSLKLERDLDAAKWRKPSHVKIDLTGAVALSPSFGGGVGGCGDCARGLGVGGLAALHATYEFGSGLGIGLATGYVQLSESVEKRAATIQATGLPAAQGAANDELRLRGILVGATASYALEAASRFPVMLRLGAGALIGSARDVRTGTFPTRTGASVAVPETVNDPSAVWVYLDPEVTIGVHVGEHFEIDAGLQALFLIAAKKAKWGDDGDPAVTLGADGFAKYPKDPITGGFVVVLAPGLGARYTF